MTNTITYHSTNAKPAEAWIAYVVLPNGDNWQVRFHGATEAEAISKAEACWQLEQAKPRARQAAEDEALAIKRAGDPWEQAAASGRGAQFIGKKWIRNSAGEKRRVDPDEASIMVASGEWQYGGPRG